MFVRSRLEHRHVDRGCLFDERYEVAQGLYAQAVLLAEPRGSGAPLGFYVHGFVFSPQVVVGMAWSFR
ncbi:hypothetical protein Q5530_25720 [Saccharothrix sp. BKS2]|uniref:hypothetical protein n=1 Tax=Saccharothrix sp. BKS2 TaxID=3064400 RepID=UPI0039EC1328